MSIAFENALMLARSGFRVFPSGAKWKMSAALQNATCDLQLIQGITDVDPNAGWRVKLGVDQGLIVVFTRHKADSRKLLERFGPLPRTWASKRPTGGLSRWFSVNPETAPPLDLGVPIPGTSARLSLYADLPDSRHEAGERYQWKIGPDEIPLARLPDKWIDGLALGDIQVTERWEWNAHARVAEWHHGYGGDPLAGLYEAEN